MKTEKEIRERMKKIDNEKSVKPDYLDGFDYGYFCALEWVLEE